MFPVAPPWPARIRIYPGLTLSISFATATLRGFKRGFSNDIVDNSNKWAFPNKLGYDPKSASNNPEEEDDDDMKKKLKANVAPASTPAPAPAPPAAKSQVVGCLPTRSYRKNIMATNNNAKLSKKKEDTTDAK